MKKNGVSVFYIQLFTMLFVSASLFAQSFEYVSPKPGSILNSDKTSLALRYSERIDESSLSDVKIYVNGSISGNHKGDLLLSDDGITLIFNPYSKFSPDEDVNIVIGNGIKTSTGVNVDQYSFKFTTAPEGIVVKSDGIFNDEITTEAGENINLNYTPQNLTNLPAPVITIDSVNNPYPGNIFMATWDRNIPAQYGNFIFVLDNVGNVVDSVRVNGAPYDFKIQPNGLLSYALGDFAGNVPGLDEQLRYIVMDDDFSVVDSFSMKNGYPTDFHEFHMLPNGHVMLMSYYTIQYDMSQIIEGGRTDASLVINIIQEQDRNKNVVFEWRNIDHIPITDSDLDLTGTRMNYGTLNAFEVDYDGNILASFRNHSEIMKISRSTGEVLWRLGGLKGEFTFIGEHAENAPYYFARQHHIHRLPNGNISVFDNGEFHTPSYSRAAEYELDEVNKTITLVSEYRYPTGNIFAAAAGNANKHDDGGWFLGYGILHPQSQVKRNIVESHADGSTAFELSLPKNVMAYRVTKQLWKEQVNAPSVTIFEAQQGNTYSYHDSNYETGVDIKFVELNGFSYNETIVTRIPYGPVNPEFIHNAPGIYPVSINYEGAAIISQEIELHIDLDLYSEITIPDRTKMYWRSIPGRGLFIDLSTNYNASANELVANADGFGEFIFGVSPVDSTANIPVLYEPADGEKFLLQDSVVLKWTGAGVYNSFNVQVSTDSLFTSLILDENLKTSSAAVGGLQNNTIYFWRINSVLGNESSEWHPAWTFEITDAFLTMTSPNGGNIWEKTTSEIIRWETNIHDSVLIDLYEGEENILSIGKTTGSNKAFQWDIQEELNVGDNYKIRITSLAGSLITDWSDSNFSIVDTIVSSLNDDLANAVNEYHLSQNYPNPFNPSTIIQYSLPRRTELNSAPQTVLLKVFDVLGREVATLINKKQSPGNYEVQFNAAGLSSGIYFYSLKAGSFYKVKRMVLLR